MAFPIYEQNEMYKCYVFNAICKNVFMQFDGIAIHQYSGTNMLDGALKDLLTYYEREFPEKDLYVTEFGLDPKCKQDRLFNYQAYYDYLEQHPRVKAACYFIQNGSYSFEGFELGAEQQELLYQTIEV